jgi:WD40 repeat protein
MKLVSGDLDWIVMKCLEKDRARRYETADGVSRDIQRYLVEEPVEASPPSAAYRLRKLARRYRVWLRVAAAFSFLLIAATIVSAWQAIRATRAKSDAFIANAAAKSAQQQTQLKLAEALVLRGDLSVLANRPDEALADYLQAQGLFRQLGTGAQRAELGLWNLYRQYPPPLNELGAEGDLQWWEHAWTQNGRAILCRRAQVPDTLTLRDLADGHEIRSFHQPGLCDYAGGQSGLWEISRDGKKLLGAANGQVLLWNVTGTGPPLHLGAHKGKVFTLAISADGRRGLSGGADKLLKLWDLQTGQQLASIQFSQLRDLSSAVLSSDGQTAAVIGGQATVLTLPDGQILHEQSSNNGFTVEWTSVKFTDDGRFALLLQGEKLTCFDLKARRIVQTFNADKTDQGGTDFFRFIALCTCGHTAAVLSDHHVTVLDYVTGRIIAHRINAEPEELGPGHEVMPPGARSPDGRRIVRVGRGHLLLEDLETEGGSREIRPGAWDVDWSSPDVIAGIDSSGTGMLATIWSSAAEPAWIEDAGLESSGLEGRCLAFSDDAQLIAGGGEGAVRVWDAHTGRELRRLPDSGPVTSLAFSPEGRSLLVARMKPGAQFQGAGDGTLTQWDLVEGRQTRRAELRSPVLSRDGRRVVCVDSRAFPKIEASVRDVQSGRELRAFSLPSPHSDQEIPPDWRELLAGDWGASSIVPIASERRMLALSIGPERAIRLYDLATGHLARTLAAPSECVAPSFSPDGRTLLSGVGSELWIWDVDSGKKLYSLPSRSGTVNSVACSGDGQAAAFGGGGGGVQVLDFSRPARYRDFAARLEQARRALRANPKDAAALATFGEWYALRGKRDWAVEYLEAARAHGHGISSVILARCYLAMNKTDAAHREFQRAMQQREASEPYLRICLAATAPKP